MNEIIQKFVSNGINIIPLKKNEKTPTSSWKKYQSKKSTFEEIERWQNQTTNFGALCGSISDNLLVIDVDNEDIYTKLGFNNLEGKTWIVKTKKGYHIYVKMPNAVKSKTLQWENKEDIRFQGEGSYVVMPGSTHPSGFIYELLPNSPPEIYNHNSFGMLSEIEERWKKYRGIDEIEKKTDKKIERRSNELKNYKNQISISSVISKYVSPISENTNYWQGHCPFHDDTTPSFTVYEDTAHWYCFGCRRYGDVFNFIMAIDKISFPEAIKKIETITEIVFEGLSDNIKKKNTTFPVMLEEMILQTEKFISLHETKELLHYRDGFWHFGGETIVEGLCRSIMKELKKDGKINTRIVSEVVKSITQSNYKERSILNQKKWFLNLQNGVYDIEKKTFMSHDPELYTTICIPIDYDPNINDDTIYNFLFEVLNKEDVQFMIDYIAYCLIPDIRYHKALFLHGDGANGKSTLMKVIRAVLGRNNITANSLEALAEDKFAKAELEGKLANIYGDVSYKAINDTGLFKMITGDDMVVAEKKFMPKFSFDNTAKLIFSANILPPVLEDTDAFYRRWEIINFPNKFEGKNAILNKSEHLITPLSLTGFLNRLILSLHAIYEGKTTFSTKTIEETREIWKRSSDPVRAFVDEKIEIAKDKYLTKDEVYSSFVTYCKQKKLTIYGKEAFGRRMEKHSFKTTQKRISGERVRCWIDVKWKDTNPLNEK